MGFLDLFRSRGRVIDLRQQHPLEQAAAIATTPIPRLDNYGYDGNSQSSQFLALDGPTPAHIEWICSLSDELGRTIARLRMEVWRRGLQVTPLHPKYCENCKEGIDEEVETEDELYECHLCGHTGLPKDPDPAEKGQLQDFMRMANRMYREDLVTAGERKTEEGLKHGRSYWIFNLLYEVADSGVIDKATLQGVYPGHSARIVALFRQDSGLPGGKFVCIRCRMKKSYKAREAPGRCDCGYVLYEATHAQTETVFGGAYNMYWLPEEVHETKWPYKDGTGPVRRLWPKVSTLLMMDWYAAWALDPKRDKRPDRILVTMGGDLNSIITQLKANAELRKKNPYAYAHLHIPSMPGDVNGVKLGADILDFGDKEFKGQMLELRQEFEAAVHKQYGLSALTAGDTDQKGGLGTNDAPQLRTTAQVAEDIQELEEKGLLRLAQKLGATQWTYTFHPALEEDEARKAEDQRKWLDLGVTAAGAGLRVEWKDGKVHIQNGQLADPNQQMMGEAPPGEEGMGFDEELPALDDLPSDDELYGDLGEGPDGVPVTQLGAKSSGVLTSEESDEDFIPDKGEDYDHHETALNADEDEDKVPDDDDIFVADEEEEDDFIPDGEEE